MPDTVTVNFTGAFGGSATLPSGSMLALFVQEIGNDPANFTYDVNGKALSPAEGITADTSVDTLKQMQHQQQAQHAKAKADHDPQASRHGTAPGEQNRKVDAGPRDDHGISAGHKKGDK